MALRQVQVQSSMYYACALEKRVCPVEGRNNLPEKTEQGRDQRAIRMEGLVAHPLHRRYPRQTWRRVRKLATGTKIKDPPHCHGLYNSHDVGRGEMCNRIARCCPW